MGSYLMPPIYEFACSTCGAHREAILRYEDMQNLREIVKDGYRFTCPACNDNTGSYKETWTKAPMARIGGSGSERDIAAMQKDCRERFVKSGEMDDIRHRHGSAFDDSIRGAAIERIKDAKGV
jgi:hypothetical protein